VRVIQTRSVGSCIQSSTQIKRKRYEEENIMAIDSSNQVERNSNMDENILFTLVKNVVNCIAFRNRKSENTIPFHLKILVKKKNIDALFNSGSQTNIITTDLVNKLGLEFHDHLIPYPLG